jgi:hypothetical protein
MNASMARPTSAGAWLRDCAAIEIYRFRYADVDNPITPPPGAKRAIRKRAKERDISCAMNHLSVALELLSDMSVEEICQEVQR